MDYGKYYLDLKKVAEIRDENEVDRIHSYYKDFLYSTIEGTNHRTKSLFHTLQMAGYLCDSEQDKRNDKLNKVLDGDKG